MATISMPSTSTQPVQQQVSAIKNGLPYDFSADTAYMAFVALPQYGPAPDPTSAQWNNATVEVDSNPTTYWVSCLVGSANGGVALTAGSYQVFVKIIDNPAVAVLAGWTLLVT